MITYIYIYIIKNIYICILINQLKLAKRDKATEVQKLSYQLLSGRGQGQTHKWLMQGAEPPWCAAWY